jgi:hypothetical protein
MIWAKKYFPSIHCRYCFRCKIKLVSRLQSTYTYTYRMLNFWFPEGFESTSYSEFRNSKSLGLHPEKKLLWICGKWNFRAQFCATCAQKYMKEKTRFSLSAYSTQFFFCEGYLSENNFLRIRQGQKELLKLSDLSFDFVYT